jgi:hypothetical protein
MVSRIAYRGVVAGKRCAVCDTLLETHLKCEDCGCLIGPGHLQHKSVMVRGRGLCECHAKWEARMRREYGPGWVNPYNMNCEEDEDDGESS